MGEDFRTTLDLSRAELAALRGAMPALGEWYRGAARDLPWRRTRDPYAVWVSEVMLQQTRVATVVPYYERWMAAFPTVEALAAAPQEAVLRIWEGLGYYSRARNLHRAAGLVVAEHGGQVPAEREAFAALPGVGPYATAAVLSIAYGSPLAAVDGNVRRILARLTATSLDPRRPPGSRAVDALAQALLCEPPSEHNQAVMELGALVCTPRKPACTGCPLAAVCRGRASGTPEAFPVRAPRKPVPHVDVAIGIVRQGARFFIDQRPTDGMLGGLWEFPGGKLEAGETPHEALVRELVEEFAMEVVVGAPLPSVRHAYTHLRVTLHPYVCDFSSMRPEAGEGRPWRWASLAELSEVAMPRANRHVLALLVQHLRG